MNPIASYLGGTPKKEEWPPIFLAGVIAAILSIIFSISFAGLIFNGALSEHLPLGIGLALIGTLVLTLSIPLTCTYPGTVGGLIAEPAIVLGIIATSLSATVADEKLMPTLLAAVMAAGLSTGAGLYIVAKLKLGQIGQYVPYPVIGGFLAGLGFILCKGALSFALPFQFSWENRHLIESGTHTDNLLLVVLVGVLIWTAQRFKPSPYNIPVLLAVGIGIFWVLMNGSPVDEVHSAGWLLGKFPESGMWSPDIPINAVQNADWTALFSELPKFIIIFLLVMISALMDASSLELAIKKDINPNRELKAVGLSNIFCGLLAGFPGTASISATKLNAGMGAHYRYVGMVATGVVLLVLFLAKDAIAFIPKFAVAGLLFYVGMDFMIEWLVATRRRVSKSDYSIIAGVFLVVALVGFMEGFLTGLVMGFIFFILTYSKLPIVKFVTDGTTRFSSIDRDEKDREILKGSGESIHIIKLQGFIFFGTARNLVEQIRERVNSDTQKRIDYLLLDFEWVNGLDSSAMVNFQKVRQYAESKNFKIWICHASTEIISLWKRYDIILEHDNTVCDQATLDEALEKIEQNRLNEYYEKNTAESDFNDPFQRLLPSDEVYQDFLKYCEKKKYEKGDYLCKQGDASNEMLLMRSGQVSIYLEKRNGQRIRLRKYMKGSIVGHMAMLLGTARSASVIADEYVLAYSLDSKALELMKKDSPQTLIEFQKTLLNITASHLQDSNRLINELGF